MIQLKQNISLKAKLFVIALMLLMIVLTFITTFVEVFTYFDMKNRCSAQTTAIVSSTSMVRYRSYRETPETQYISEPMKRKQRMQLLVDTDSRFRYKSIYADSRGEKAGNKLIIHYSPADPDTYYIGDRVNDYRNTAVIMLVLGVLVLFSSAALTILLFIRPQTLK